MPLNALDRSARAHNPKVGGSNPPPATGPDRTEEVAGRGGLLGPALLLPDLKTYERVSTRPRSEG
jgi:hypothetical protein